MSSANATVQVQASSGAYVFGAVSPAPTVTGSACGVTFNEYFDPSGKVQSTTGIPLESATVRLVRSLSKKGSFKAVPKGSTIMSTSNRRNPDHTSVLGVFGWNTIPGYYRVQASHPGCTAGGSGRKAKKTIETRIYKVPPPVDNIVIKLKCKGLNVRGFRVSRCPLVPALTKRPSSSRRHTSRSRRATWATLTTRRASTQDAGTERPARSDSRAPPRGKLRVPPGAVPCRARAQGWR